MIHPLKVTSTLADETRYHIYEFMLQQKKTFSVQDIANQFSIHPNVARLHLTKLSEINVITSDFVKSGKGGRPGRVYKASEKGIELSFPKRDDSKLLKWTLQLIKEIGPNAVELAKKISHDDGFHHMQSLLSLEQKGSQTISFDEKLTFLSNASSMIGYFPDVQDTNQGKKILFTIYNCPFKNQLATNNKLICELHECYLKGQVDALFSKNDIIQLEKMNFNCDFCKYEINVTDTAL